MDNQVADRKTQPQKVTVEDVNRLLEVGRLLFSVLTPEEIEELQEILAAQEQIGNTGDS
jgi:hypothetical protein